MDKGILRGLFGYYKNISIIDVMKDTISKLSLQGDQINIESTASYSSYIQNLNQFIKEEYIPDYTKVSAISNIEQNPNGCSVIYETVDGNKCRSIFFIDALAQSQIIYELSEPYIGSNESSQSIATITNLVSDAVLKIYNIFEANTESNLRIDDVETYINSILTNLTSNYKELKQSLTKKAINLSGQSGKSIMIVDDDLVTRTMLKKIFVEEYNIIEATNGREAIDIIKANSNKSVYEKTTNIVGMFLDLTMPVADGFQVLDFMTENNMLSSIPVIIISGDYEKETRNRAYNYNIADMIEKPFDFQIIKHRINNFINLYKSSNSLNSLLINQNGSVSRITNNILKAYQFDYKDKMDKISSMLNILANQVMTDYPEYKLDENKVSKMSLAVKYYDLGIYEIPRNVFNKKSLTEEEKKFILDRISAGVDILDAMFQNNDDVLYKNYCYEILKCNHEYYSGIGYPKGLKEEQIPISAQLASICIDYVNLTLRQEKDTIINIIIQNTKGKYNPKLIESFKKIKDSI